MPLVSLPLGAMRKMKKYDWYGVKTCNLSMWRKDFIAVNGFDERMQYGGEDRELGERLFNFGVKSKQLRYSAVCVHLDHERGYRTPEAIAKNQVIRKEVKQNKSVWTYYGITK